ncbi:DNA repair protein Rev1 [Diabrotica undecimpunctata]|uniref:DNA repair protein Rev1 n=1 Tax=Diabrotica undecimpunctata TaxID=50387 RepID=UPI003B633016
MNGKSDGTVKEETDNKKKKSREFDQDNGFNEWGGYMAAKRAKLLNQFEGSNITKLSNIFEGVSIHVNGLTRPPIDELKNLMAAHGGVFHMYQVSSTTHIIASNLPNVKIKHLGTTPIVKPAWITDSIDFGKLLDYRRYLLYNNQSKSQPKIGFPVIEKMSASASISENDSVNIESNTVFAETSSVVIQNSTAQVKSEKLPLSNQINRFPTKTASDPNFLEEFYNNSRLHLISTLGAEFKHLVGQMRESSDGKFPGLEKLISCKVSEGTILVPSTVIMHIDMDCFFVSVSLRNHPELKGKPVAITHARNGQLSNVRPDQKSAREQEFSLYSERLPVGVTSRVDQIDTQSSMSEIASCSYEARKFGIKNGTFLGQAIKMCPELKTLPYDFEGIKEVSHTLYRTVASYTLDIEAVSCDEMYVDVTKILRKTGLTVEEWASLIRNEIRTITGCPCSAGFGANRLQARLATRKAKPEGQFYLKPEEVENHMVELPLSDLPGVGRATLAKLQKLGLFTCGDVQLTSLKVLQNEIGQKAGETIKEQSVGVDSKALNFYHERKSVSADVNYGIRFKTLQECHTFLENLSAEVYNRMNEINMRARCLTLKLLVRAPEAPVETAKFLGHGICDSLTKSTTSNSVLSSPQIIFKEAKILYEKLGADFADLRGVGLQLTKLEKNAPINKALTNFLKQHNQNKVPEKAPTTNKDVEKDSLLPLEQQEKKPKIVAATTVKQKETPNASIGSRRGRPRGGKNNTTRKAVPKSSNVMTVNQYFGHAKSSESNSKLKQNPHNIDMQVFNQLPENLKQEIIREYNLEEQVTLSQENSLPNCQQNTLIQDAKPEIPERKTKTSSQESVEQESSKKSPFNNLSWDQIKPIIKKWTASEESPCDFDTEMLAEHFKQLAINRKIEVLMSVFNFLHRVFSELNCSWHNSYFKMVNITQEGMVARYGRTLLVKRRFNCCGM